VATLGDIRNEIKNDYVGNFLHYTDASINKNINRTREEIAELIRISNLLQSTNITTSNGVATYSIPRATKVYYVYNKDTNKLIELWIPDIVLNQKLLNNIPNKGEPHGFQIRGNSITFYPTPDKTYNIEVLLYLYPTALVLDSDHDYISDYLEEAVIKGTVYRLFSAIGSFDLAQAYYQEYINQLDIKENIEREKFQQQLLSYKKKFPEIDVREIIIGE
jgi:hypothetical protein